MLNILITGCAGFIGSHLCEKLCVEGYKIIGIDILNDYYDINIKKKNLEILSKYDNFSFYRDNIVNTDIFDRYKFDIVINLAALCGVRNSLNNPEIYFETNVVGTSHLLNQCVKHNIKKYIYASSSSVYGTNTKIPFSEEDIIDNLNSPYAVSKRNSEDIAKLYSRLYNIQTIGFRFFTVYGERGRPDMAPYKFLYNIWREIPIDKYGKGDSKRDYTYVKDIVDGIASSIFSDKKCEIYNLGNEYPISLNKFIETCEKVTGKKAIINQLGEQLGDVPITYANIEKAKKELGYNPKTRIEDGLFNMFEWIKN